MVSGKVKIINKLGIHLRPATLLSKNAIEFQSNISLKKGTSLVNVKSVLGVLGACVKQNDEVEIICDGPDEEEAYKKIVKLIEDGLGDHQ